MTTDYLDGAAAIEAECFSHPTSRESLGKELESESSLYFAAVEDEKVIGYIGANVVLDECYIYNIVVTPEHRRRGVGTALITQVLNHCKRNSFSFATLEVRKNNAPARSLYSHLGFIEVGERRDYYSDPKENAILMTKYF